MAVVSVPQTSTRHLPPSGATPNDECLSPTNLTFSCNFTTMFKKLIYVRHLAVSYGCWTILNRTKVNCLVIHPVVNLQKGHFKISVAHTCKLQKTLYIIYLWPYCQKVKLVFKLTNFRPPILMTIWKNRKFMQGTKYNLTSRSVQPTPVITLWYKKYCNILTYVIKQQKKTYYDEFISTSKNKTKLHGNL
jgi:hypothetical protein